VSRAAIVVGKVLGGTTIALLQGALLLPLAPLVGIPLAPHGLALALVALGTLALSLTALGFILAWRMESMQGFHGIVNLVLMPLWFLSGALFPLHGASPGLRLLMRLDPVTYGLAAFRRALYASEGIAEIDPALAWTVSAGFAVVTLVAAIVLARR
jgi:ABC-2 type transport system permease protein